MTALGKGRAQTNGEKGQCIGDNTKHMFLFCDRDTLKTEIKSGSFTIIIVGVQHSNSNGDMFISY